MDISNSEKHKRFIDEMTGDSKDKPIRKALEDRAVQLLWGIHSGNYTQAEDWFANDITMIFDLNDPGFIFKGKDEALAFLSDGSHPLLHSRFGSLVYICPILVVADRGLITCYIEHVEARFKKPMTNRTMVVIIDLNTENQIKRFEYRSVGVKQEIPAHEESDFLTHMHTKPMFIK